MLKLSQFIIFAILAFNLTMFAFMLQMDMLIFKSPVLKAISWVASVAVWVLAYRRRKKFITLF